MKAVKLIAFMVLGALIYQGGQTAVKSPALRLSRFEVKGHSEARVSTRQIVAATGLQVGDRLVGISTKRVAERLQKLPWIKSARVERILPSTLRISVEQRRPWLVVQTDLGPYLVDQDGRVLGQGSESLVVVHGLPLGRLTPGERITTAEFSHVSRILASLPDGVRSTVSGVRAPSIDQIEIETRGGPVISYGAAELLQAKNFAAETLLRRAESGTANAGVIDVRVPSRPATRMR